MGYQILFRVEIAKFLLNSCYFRNLFLKRILCTEQIHVVSFAWNTAEKK
jgi:hypothetical protein